MANINFGSPRTDEVKEIKEVFVSKESEKILKLEIPDNILQILKKNTEIEEVKIELSININNPVFNLILPEVTPVLEEPKMESSIIINNQEGTIKKILSYFKKDNYVK